MKPRSALTPFVLPILAAASLVALGGIPYPARACRVPPSPFAMEVLVGGRPLTELAANGATYVEALAGRDYSLRLTNRTDARVAVALSVDGLNVIDARHTAARDGRKWILDPRQSIVIDGWQVDSENARRFVFTTEHRSYGTWLGKTADLGVISAAFFRERVPVAAPQPLAKEERFEAPKASADARGKRDDLAATGIGGKVDHRVFEVDFEAEQAAASVVTLRYEYREALVRLGVLPRESDGALARRERARGFTDAGFAPDPYRD